ncbi:unnamed protein product [Echinostoma caproni]|uniref:J domain-containing protein n=1 Tax=Echinostoma caproni TaxID=27848 RepID=A0A183AGN5_9TREM|nr:unnamed protein product [Echinostoma caproni]
MIDGNFQFSPSDFTNMEDPYQVLGVTSNATAEEIRSAYYEQSKRVHPDRSNAENSNRASSEAFLRLSDAYSLLSNPSSRRMYDQYVASQRNGVWSRMNASHFSFSAIWFAKNPQSPGSLSSYPIDD